ncbi:Protein translocase subunit SecE [Gammaproteobacteria bacterium]
MSDQLKLGLAVLVLTAGIGAFYYFSDLSTFIRIFALLVAGGATVAIVLQTVAGREAWDFVLESRGEVRKVVWPTRAETVQATLVVVGMVVVMALLMWFLDALLLWAVRLLTSSGG